MKALFLVVAIGLYIAGVSATSHHGSGPFYTTTCERQTAALGCDDGSVIRIVHAFYGRDDETTCPGTIKTTKCSASNALKTVQQRCDGRAYCVVPSHNDVFGDPCKGTYKFMRITHRCVRERNIRAISHICERDHGHISCPKGQTIGIVDAFYGRDDTVHCPGRHRSTTCRSDTSLSIIKRLCEGNRSCRISSLNSVFGDPCRGTTKFVKVLFFCH